MSKVYVAIQMLILGIYGIQLVTNISVLTVLSIIMLVVSVILGAHSLYIMNKISKVNVFPELRENANLVKSGIYNYIRHPMYTSVLLFCLGTVLSFFNFLNLIIFVLMFYVLTKKIKIEEKQLTNKFPEYRDYKKSTKKIIPYLY